MLYVFYKYWCVIPFSDNWTRRMNKMNRKKCNVIAHLNEYLNYSYMVIL